MLVLTRKPKDSILVDGPCRITVLNARCKLGIEGSAQVVRGEVAQRESLPTGRRTVYLVDDDTNLLQAYQCYFKHFDFDVKPFSQGRAFLQHAKNANDALAVILDLRLADEDIDGLQILQQLRAWNHDYPVILLTGYGDVDSCRRAFHSGCYTFLQKPISPEDLATTLKEAAARYRQGEADKRRAFNSLAV